MPVAPCPPVSLPLRSGKALTLAGNGRGHVVLHNGMKKPNGYIHLRGKLRENHYIISVHCRIKFQQYKHNQEQKGIGEKTQRQTEVKRERARGQDEASPPHPYLQLSSLPFQPGFFCSPLPTTRQEVKHGTVGIQEEAHAPFPHLQCCTLQHT